MSDRINNRELDVLNILWSSNEEMTSTDICECMKGLTQSTTIAVLRKLLQEDLVEVAGVTHSGRVLSRTYRPTEASKKHLLDNFVDSYKSFSNVISISEMCKTILEVEQSPEELKKEIKKIRKIIDSLEASS